MAAIISVQSVRPRKLAAVRRQAAIGKIGSAWRSALDQVWQFLRRHPGLRADGHNIFLYHHPADMNLPMNVDFGVEVTRSFEPAKEVFATETPAGQVATPIHVGPYDRLPDTHGAIHAWAKANHRLFAGQSWGIYGDPTEDPSKLETTIAYLLK